MKNASVFIVNHMLNGREINKIYNEWTNINTGQEWDVWQEKVKRLRFGTYSNMDILDLLPRFNPVFPVEWHRDVFIEELKLALGLSDKVICTNND